MIHAFAALAAIILGSVLLAWVFLVGAPREASETTLGDVDYDDPGEDVDEGSE